MPNTLLTDSIIAKEAAIQVRNSMQMARTIHIGYEEDFGKKVGNTISYRKPQRLLAYSGATLATQDFIQQTGQLVLSNRFHVPIRFTTEELTLSLDDFSEQVIQPAAIALASQIEKACAAEILNLENVAPDSGASLASNALQKFLNMQAVLGENAVPTGDRMNMFGAFSPQQYANIVGGVGNVFSTNITEEQVEMGIRGELSGTYLGQSQLISQHTHGSMAGGGALVNGAVSSGTSLPLDNISGGGTTLSVGDTFTVANVFAVNPITKDSTGRLKSFRVTAAHTGGNGTISFAPAIVTSGPYQNVTAAMADNAAITFDGTASATVPVGAAYHRHAISLVTVPLELPNAPFAARAEYEGISVRVVKDYDISDDEDVARLDILFGTTASYPDFGVKYFDGV